MSFLSIDLLQRPSKILTILVHLLDHEETKASVVMEELGLSPSTYNAAIRRLVELELAFKREESGFPRRSFVGLTLKGREVATRLRPVSDLLEDTVSGLRSELDLLDAKTRNENENARMMEILVSMMNMEFATGRWDESETHARRALDVASVLEDDGTQAECLRLLGDIHFSKGMRERAYEEATRSLHIFGEIGDPVGVAQSRYLLGSIMERDGDLQEARGEFESSLASAKEAEDDVLRAKANLGIGRVLARRGRYEESLEKFRESIETFERLDEAEELPRAYTSAGASAFYLDIDEALEWHEKCMQASRQIGDVVMLGYGLSNAAGCLVKKKDTARAHRYLERASEIFQTLDQRDMIAGVNIQLGLVCWQEAKWTKSEKAFTTAVDIARRHAFKYELADALLNLGLMNLDRDRKQSAKRQLKEALKLFDQLDNRSKAGEAKRALKEINR